MMVVPATVQEWAKYYIELGWHPIPLIPGTKKGGPGWETIEHVPADFRDNDNIGVRHEGDLTFIDLDSPEAVACADLFLPSTGAIYGRPSKPRSKRLYRSTFPKTIKYQDRTAKDVVVDANTHKDKSCLVEIRANGNKEQDMVPPSKHPDGELLEWDSQSLAAGLSPVEVEPLTLLRAVRLVATCSVLSRHYNPTGSRHEWTLAISGVLRGLGCTIGESEQIFRGSARWAKDDKVSDRLLEIRSTYERGEDEPIIAGKALDKLMDGGKVFLATLKAIWGSTGKDVQGFIVDRNEHINPRVQDNIILAMDKLGVDVKFNAFTRKPMANYAGFNGTLEDEVQDRIWLHIDKRFHFQPGYEFYERVLWEEAYKRRYHPVLDYLETLKWDGKPRVDTWLIQYGGAEDSDYMRAICRLVLVAAVRRVVQPGCKFDEMLVLESPEQGKLKSTAIRTLCPDPEWFSDDLPLGVNSQQLIEATAGKWICECPDLYGRHKAKPEHVKAMLSRQVDGPVRMAYDRLASERPRQFIIIGTTNADVYLSDPTGNRRFLPALIDQFNIVALRRDRDQLWAEASYKESQWKGDIRLDASLWSAAAEQQDRRRESDPWEPVLKKCFEYTYQRKTDDWVYGQLGFADVSKRTVEIEGRLRKVMRLLGFHRGTVSETIQEQGTTREEISRGWCRGEKTDKEQGTLFPYRNPPKNTA